MSFKFKASLLAFVLINLLSVANADSINDYEFAEKLFMNGYTSLAVKKYEMALNKGKVAAKNKDNVYLTLFKSYETLANNTSGSKQAKFKTKAKEYFNKIENKDSPEIKLEIVKSSLAGLRKIQSKIELSNNTAKEDQKLKADEKARLIKDARGLFSEVATVADKIRLDAREWIVKYDELDPREQKKQAKKKAKTQQMEGTSNLQFGEACVLYANIAGSEDADVRKWLQKMAKNYQEFISEYYGTAYAIIGGIYLGEVSVLLKKFKDDYDEEVDGIELGLSNFSDAIAGLEEMPNQYKKFKNNWLITAYTKQAMALNQVGKVDEALAALEDLFNWNDIDAFSPKRQANEHNRLMGAWQFKCKILRKQYDDGDKAKLNVLHQAVTKAFVVTQKNSSPWHPNFKFMKGKLPEGNVELDINGKFLKAKDLYYKTFKTEDSKTKYDLYLKASSLFKDVLGLSIADGKDKMIEFYPESAYRLGGCYVNMGNYLLGLATYLRAVDLFPSDKYSKKSHPKIYDFVRDCAKNAKIAASKRFKIGGKKRFDQSLYEMTLKIMSEKFPEEGGNPDYWLGILKESVDDFSGAKKDFAKVESNNDLYLMAQYHIVYCDYRVFKAKENKEKAEYDSIIKKFEKIISLASTLPKKRDDEEEKAYNRKIERIKKAKESSVDRIAKLLYDSEQFDRAIAMYRKQFKETVDAKEKKTVLSKIIIANYKLEKQNELESDIALFEKLKTYEGFSQDDKNESLANYYKMQANFVSKDLKALGTNRTDEQKAQAVKFMERIGDLYFKAVKLDKEKDIGLLTSSIGLFLQNKSTAEKALDALNLYFKWNPDKPEIDQWHRELIGQKKDKWDQKIGSYIGVIKVNAVKAKYEEFLDYLFDEQDYSKMSISNVQKTRKATGDMPRNYNKAIKAFEELNKLKKKDRSFEKEVLPQLSKFFIKLKSAKNYYDMRYKQAECYSILDKYDQAAEVYRNIALYFVEYPSIRIELAKSEFAQSNYEKAKGLFKELISVVPSPLQGGSYDPLDYFTLLLWKSQTDYKMLKNKDDPVEVLEIWKYMRSRLYLDTRYLKLEEKRLKELKISINSLGKHENLIAKLKELAEGKILSVVKKGSSSLKDDTWSKLVGK